MSDFYTIASGRPYPYYAELESSSIPYKFQDACYNSLFQHIKPDEPMTLMVTEESEEVYADFMYVESVPLISERFRNLLDDFGIDNLLYKKIILKHPSTHNEYECWLALPPVIDCLDFDKSEFIPIIKAVKKIVIDEKKVGRYDIFKIASEHARRAASNEIIITEKLHSYLLDVQEKQGFKLESVYMIKL